MKSKFVFAYVWTILTLAPVLAFVQSITTVAHATVVTAVGSNGTIIQSLDSGETWAPQSSNTGPSQTAPPLKDVDFINVNSGWAIGDSLGTASGLPDPTVRRTSNGGQTWQIATVPPVVSQPGHGITGVHFVTTDAGWLIGNPGLVFQTTDGGTTWLQQSNGVPPIEFYDLDFVDLSNGWIVGRGITGIILHTADGGANWNTQSVYNDIMLGVDFVDANTGWTVGTNSIRHTTDGGATWDFQIGGYFRDVEFVDAMTGWVVGRNGIMHTSDGGANWTEQYRSANSRALHAVDFINSDEGWAAGEAGIVLHTTNGGATWLPQTTGTNATLSGISAVIPEPSALIVLVIGGLGIACPTLRFTLLFTLAFLVRGLRGRCVAAANRLTRRRPPRRVFPTS